MSIEITLNLSDAELDFLAEVVATFEELHGLADTVAQAGSVKAIEEEEPAVEEVAEKTASFKKKRNLRDRDIWVHSRNTWV